MLTNLPMRPRSLNSTTPVTFANRVSSLPQPTLRPGFSLVPRCRTMMDPPGTSWPPNTFTPRRCAFESRPFLELPRPFLCAIRHLRQIADLPFGEVLAMADHFLVLLLPLELEDQNFRGSSVSHDRSLHGGGSVNQLAAVAEHRFHGNLDFRTDVTRQLGDTDRFARRHGKLLSAAFDNR